MVPQFAQAVDYFLSLEGSKHIPELHRIATLPSSADTDALMLGYALEGVRLAGTFGSYREAAADDVIRENDGSSSVSIRAGDRVFVSFVSGLSSFPSPNLSSLFSLSSLF